MRSKYANICQLLSTGPSSEDALHKCIRWPQSLSPLSDQKARACPWPLASESPAAPGTGLSPLEARGKGRSTDKQSSLPPSLTLSPDSGLPLLCPGQCRPCRRRATQAFHTGGLDQICVPSQWLQGSLHGDSQSSRGRKVPPDPGAGTRQPLNTCHIFSHFSDRLWVVCSLIKMRVIGPRK